MQAPRNCSRCGLDLDSQAVFCSRCGQPAQGATEPPRPYPSTRDQLAALQQRLPGNLATIPLELLAVVALIVASAMWLCVTVALHVHDVATLFDNTDGASAPGLALYALATLVIVSSFCCWLGFLAWRLTEADPRARAVWFVPLIGYGLAVLFSNAGVDGAPGTRAALHSLDSHGAMPIATMLMCWAAAFVLSIAPRNREFFGVVAANGRPALRFDPVRVARDLLIAFRRRRRRGRCHVPGRASDRRLVRDQHRGEGARHRRVVHRRGRWFDRDASPAARGDPLARADGDETALVFGFLVLMAIVEGQGSRAAPSALCRVSRAALCVDASGGSGPLRSRLRDPTLAARLAAREPSLARRATGRCPALRRHGRRSHSQPDPSPPSS